MWSQQHASVNESLRMAAAAYADAAAAAAYYSPQLEGHQQLPPYGAMAPATAAQVQRWNAMAAAATSDDAATAAAAVMQALSMPPPESPQARLHAAGQVRHARAAHAQQHARC
jgi:hypothetical protein